MKDARNIKENIVCVERVRGETVKNEDEKRRCQQILVEFMVDLYFETQRYLYVNGTKLFHLPLNSRCARGSVVSQLGFSFLVFSRLAFLIIILICG